QECPGLRDLLREVGRLLGRRIARRSELPVSRHARVIHGMAEDVVPMRQEGAHLRPRATGRIVTSAGDDAESRVEAALRELRLGEGEYAARAVVANIVVDDAVRGGGVAAPRGHAVHL